jgi:hypothetical protein
MPKVEDAVRNVADIIQLKQQIEATQGVIEAADTKPNRARSPTVIRRSSVGGMISGFLQRKKGAVVEKESASSVSTPSPKFDVIQAQSQLVEKQANFAAFIKLGLLTTAMNDSNLNFILRFVFDNDQKTIAELKYILKGISNLISKGNDGLTDNQIEIKDTYVKLLNNLVIDIALNEDMSPEKIEVISQKMLIPFLQKHVDLFELISHDRDIEHPTAIQLQRLTNNHLGVVADYYLHEPVYAFEQLIRNRIALDEVDEFRSKQRHRDVGIGDMLKLEFYMSLLLPAFEPMQRFATTTESYTMNMIDVLQQGRTLEDRLMMDAVLLDETEEFQDKKRRDTQGNEPEELSAAAEEQLYKEAELYEIDNTNEFVDDMQVADHAEYKKTLAENIIRAILDQLGKYMRENGLHGSAENEYADALIQPTGPSQNESAKFFPETGYLRDCFLARERCIAIEDQIANLLDRSKNDPLPPPTYRQGKNDTDNLKQWDKFSLRISKQIKEKQQQKEDYSDLVKDLGICKTVTGFLNAKIDYDRVVQIRESQQPNTRPPSSSSMM